MKVRFSEKTKEDFRKHREYLRRTGKPDGHKYQNYELDGISKSLRKNISKGLESTDEHKDSIYPKEFEYNAVVFHPVCLESEYSRVRCKTK